MSPCLSLQPESTLWISQALPPCPDMPVSFIAFEGGSHVFCVHISAIFRSNVCCIVACIRQRTSVFSNSTAPCLLSHSEPSSKSWILLCISFMLLSEGQDTCCILLCLENARSGASPVPTQCQLSRALRLRLIL